ncbi:MAG: hypothetical protein RLZ87_1415 [Armatimonadota bacterium]
MHIVIIANPTSARGRGRKRKQELITLLEQAIDLAKQQTNATHTYQIIETTAPGSSIKTNQKNLGSAAYLAHQAATNPEVKADIVAAAGGDGTIGEVANGLIGTNTPLGVLPMGTGNDFARTLGINTDLPLAVQTLFQGTAKPVDLGKIENGGYFLNIAGCGYDAEVAARINHGFKRLKGTTAYVVAALQTLAKFKGINVNITAENTTNNSADKQPISYQGKLMLCAVANAKMYGGGMKIAPNADISDGKFSIVLVGNVSQLEFLLTFPKVFKGTHIHHPKVTAFEATKITIHADQPMPTLADGEEIGTTPITFTIVPNALTVLHPPTNL